MLSWTKNYEKIKPPGSNFLNLNYSYRTFKILNFKEPNCFMLTDDPWLALGGVGPRGWRIFFLTSTRWLPMYENQNPATISRQKCYQMYLWLFQTSKMNFLPNDAIFYRSVPKVAYWWVEQHIKRSVSAPQPLQSYRMMKFHLGSKLFSYMRILLRKKIFLYNIYPIV